MATTVEKISNTILYAIRHNVHNDSLHSTIKYFFLCVRVLNIPLNWVCLFYNWKQFLYKWYFFCRFWHITSWQIFSLILALLIGWIICDDGKIDKYLIRQKVAALNILDFPVSVISVAKKSSGWEESNLWDNINLKGDCLICEFRIGQYKIIFVRITLCLSC